MANILSNMFGLRPAWKIIHALLIRYYTEIYFSLYWTTGNNKTSYVCRLLGKSNEVLWAHFFSILSVKWNINILIAVEPHLHFFQPNSDISYVRPLFRLLMPAGLHASYYIICCTKVLQRRPQRSLLVFFLRSTNNFYKMTFYKIE